MARKRIWRLWHSARLTLARGSARKKAYSDKHGLFAGFGDNVVFQPKVLPLYSELVKIHDNVVVGRNVEFVTHDVIHHVLSKSELGGGSLHERIGCIEVMDNTFIGNGAIVMYGVKIAENNIIAAGSVVTKDTEPDSVYAGVPARRIGSAGDVAAKRLAQEAAGDIATTTHNQNLTSAEVEAAWLLFERDHGKAIGRARSQGGTGADDFRFLSTK